VREGRNAVWGDPIRLRVHMNPLLENTFKIKKWEKNACASVHCMFAPKFLGKKTAACVVHSSCWGVPLISELVGFHGIYISYTV
jgi:hypothetical protein